MHVSRRRDPEEVTSLGQVLAGLRSWSKASGSWPRNSEMPGKCYRTGTEEGCRKSQGCWEDAGKDGEGTAARAANRRPTGQEDRVRSKKAHQSAGSTLEEGVSGRGKGQSVEGEASKRYAEP